MNLNQALLNRMLLEVWRVALLFGLACVVAVGASSQTGTSHPTTTANNFLEVPVRPVAIGHHGVGPNLGSDPTIPIENTVDSVRLAYSLGARVVEVDVQLTADGKLAVFHNDFLTDFTCVDSLTIDQLQQRMPFVPELHQVLEVARQVNRQSGNALGGILVVELKALSPHCDPDDNLEQTIVSTAVAEIHQAKIEDQVMFDSFSPALLLLASQAAPAIPRELDISGLQWAEIGPVFRLPGYSSPLQFLETGLATQVRVVGGEIDFFGPAEQQQPGSGSAFVAGAHSFGFRVFADPAQTAADWNFFAGLGVDAIYSNIPLGVQLEPAIPNPLP